MLKNGFHGGKKEAVRFGEAEAVRRGMMDESDTMRGPGSNKRMKNRGAATTTLGQMARLGD